MCDPRWFFSRVFPSFAPIRPGFPRSRLFWRITELCSLARCSESTLGVPRGAQSRAVIYAAEHVPCLRHQMIAGGPAILLPGLLHRRLIQVRPAKQVYLREDVTWFTDFLWQL